MTAIELATQLKARKLGSTWMALCPAHRDRNPSLAITEGQDGKVLFYCHAGCTQNAVLAAVRQRQPWPAEHLRSNSINPGVLVATYDYHDENGQLLYQVCRYEPKTFRPRRPVGRDSWRYGYGGVRRVLYRIPELLEAPIVFVPEGERDCETLRSHGFAATTNPGGANGWRDEFNHYFSGREVIILPDNDPPGWRRALQIARGILPYAASVRIYEVRDGKDITDWFDRGHGEIELLDELEPCRVL